MVQPVVIYESRGKQIKQFVVCAIILAACAVLYFAVGVTRASSLIKVGIGGVAGLIGTLIFGIKLCLKPPVMLTLSADGLAAGSDTIAWEDFAGAAHVGDEVKLSRTSGKDPIEVDADLLPGTPAELIKIIDEYRAVALQLDSGHV